ncbi:hypothetical protein HDV57DRAFT_247822 [Trichoderma longibrachiatum]
MLCWLRQDPSADRDSRDISIYPHLPATHSPSPVRCRLYIQPTLCKSLYHHLPTDTPSFSRPQRQSPSFPHCSRPGRMQEETGDASERSKVQLHKGHTALVVLILALLTGHDLM